MTIGFGSTSLNFMADALALLIETHALSKRYGRNLLAVDSVNLTVRRGEVYGFLGPNGAGKTTTLRMLVGLVRPTSGTATVAGHPPGSRLSLRAVGSLIETASFYPYLSGRANLRLMAQYARAPRTHVERVLDEVGLAASAQRRFGTYSLGMKQRLGVAAALLKEPELVIMDEPANGLDPEGLVEMRTLIRELVEHGRTVMLSSHQLSEVEQICDRVGVIQGGRMVVETAVKELRGSSKLLIRASPADEARAALLAFAGADAVQRVDGAFHVAVDTGRAAELTRSLCAAGLQVSEVRPLERSLEDAFLDLMHDEAGRD